MPHSVYSKTQAAISRLIHREMYYSEFVGYVSQQLSDNVSNPYLKKILYDQGMRLLQKIANKRLLKYFDGQRFDLKGVFLPDIRSNDLLFAGLSYTYNDIFNVHCEKSGDYSYKIVDPLDRRFPEGTYFYIGPNNENIVLKPGNIVIDAGAWIGDFSALAAHLVGKTGMVYAFEPSQQVMRWLKITASYYPNLTPIASGLGDVNQKLFYHEDQGGGGKFVDSDENGDSIMEIKRLDDWVSENQIPRIDFIKADIEGFERKMLMGAKRVLRDFGPILSLCTYHLPDDLVVLENIILESNPNYKFIQRRNKLFAFVPQSHS